jgi:hypothetical protein
MNPRRLTPMLVCASAALMLGLPAAGQPRPGAAPRTAPAPAPAPAPPPNPHAAALAQFELDQRARARQAQIDGRPADAQLAWAAVLALVPADAEALAGFDQAAALARNLAQERVRRAEQARARGEVEAAMRWHLEALAHDAGLAESAQALRTLERERALRNAPPTSFARAMSPTTQPATAAPTGSRANPFAPELDNAELLLAEGDLDAALALLEPVSRDPRADNTLKQRTCELLLRQAETRATSRRAEALAAVQRCLRLLPQHAAAQRQARTLREPAK